MMIQTRTIYLNYSDCPIPPLPPSIPHLVFTRYNLTNLEEVSSPVCWGAQTRV